MCLKILIWKFRAHRLLLSNARKRQAKSNFPVHTGTSAKKHSNFVKAHCHGAIVPVLLSGVFLSTRKLDLKMFEEAAQNFI